MAAIRIFRRLSQLLDVGLTAPADGDTLAYNAADEVWENTAGGGGGGAPTDATYLVTTAHGDLSAEVAVGATPGGELGGTWAAPTVDASHAGSTHAAVQAAAEATAAAALTGHEADTTAVHGVADTSALYRAGGTDVAVADGGTGASNAAGARANLDLEPGTDMPSQAAFDDHSARHENGGADEISVAGLSGLLADAQTATAHAHAGEDITSGTVADARIAATIARDSEVTSAANAAQAAAEATASAALGAHTGDTSDAHDASAISILDAANDFTATDVEAALAELQSDHEADATGLSDHLADTTAAHAASAIAFTPDGSIAATTVQAAIVEVRDEAGSGDPVPFVGTSAPPSPDDGDLWWNTDDAGGSAAASQDFVDAHLADTTAAHAASAIAFTPAGTIAATDVQAALAEVAGEVHPSIVTSLPGSPSNGDEVYFRAGSGDTSILWHLRYDSSVTDTYKWRFLGGPGLANDSASGAAIAPGTSYATPSNAPTVTLPALTGVFDIEFGGGVFCSVAGSAPMTIAIKMGAAASDDADSWRQWYAATANTVYHGDRVMQRTITTSAIVLLWQCKLGVASGNLSHEHAYLRVIPVRVI